MKKSITMSMRPLVYTLLGIGILFIILGLSIGLLVQGFEIPEEEEIFRYVFTGTFGGIGVIIAFVALLIEKHFRKIQALKDRLISEGNFGWGEIVDISAQYNYNSYNISHVPCVLRCAIEHNGQSYICKSGQLRFNPKALLPDGKVKVWFDAYDIQKYYVDVEGSMKNPIVEI